jgi:hypothetical protein
VLHFCFIEYTDYFEKSDDMPAENSQLDALHDSLRQLTQQLHDCAQDEICSAYEQLLVTAEKAFAAEQLMMERHDFPATRISSGTARSCALRIASGSPGGDDRGSPSSHPRWRPPSARVV